MDFFCDDDGFMKMHLTIIKRIFMWKCDTGMGKISFFWGGGGRRSGKSDEFLLRGRGGS